MTKLTKIEILNNILLVDSTIARQVEYELNKTLPAAKLLGYKAILYLDYAPEMDFIYFQNEWNGISLIFEHLNDEILEISLHIRPLPHGKEELYSSRENNDFMYPFKKLMEVL